VTLPVRVLFEDDWIIAVDKPAGMATHSGAGIRTGTLADWVAEHLGPRAVRNDFHASPAHRLDRETSGIVLIAKRRPAMVKLTEAFTKGQVSKTYLALARGVPSPTTDRIDEPLKTLEAPIRLQPAVTQYRVVERFGDCSLIECSPKTGRKHQIRRHLALRGHPLAGDSVYGDPDVNAAMRQRFELRRMFLHAARIELAHPKDARPLVIESPLPVELMAVLDRLRSAAR
jgi:23S rRNA pseudouridine955/2504/2580 synthase